MDIEKIEKFIDAGYTKEDIERMSAGGNAEGIQTADEHGAEGAKPGESKESGAENPTHDNAVSNEMLKTLTDTVVGLQETVKALQAQNVSAAKSASPKTGDKIKEAMDSFIATL